MPDGGRTGRLLPAAALVALLLFDVLRVWLPSLLFVVGDAGSTSALTMGAIALSVALAAPAIILLLRQDAARVAWPIGVGVLAVARIGLQASDGGLQQFLLSSAGLIAAALALGALAAGASSGVEARTGVVLGLAASAAIHAGLGTTDLVWRPGLLPTMVMLTLVAALIWSALALQPLLDTSADHSAAGARAWWLLGPILLLFALLVAPPGRVAAATNWIDPLVAATVVAASGLLYVGAVLGRWLGASLSGPTGAALVLVGTAGALEAASVIAVISQIGLALGLGLLVGAVSGTLPGTSARSRAVAGAGFPAVFVAIGTLYYAGYDIVLQVPNRAFLLVTALVIAGVGLRAGATGERDMVRERDLGRRVAMIMGMTALVAGVAAGLVSGSVRAVPEAGARDEPIRLALSNIHMGFDTDGRYSIPELGDILAAGSPDIVVLNEVDRGWLTTGGHDPLRQLSARLQMPYTFGPAADEIWGNAVLSRYPVLETSVERLPRGRDAMARTQLTVVLEVAPNERVAVVATHLSHVDVQGDTRLPQARSIAATIARLQERGVPVIVAGDLNAQPGDPELTTLEDLATSAVPSGTPTFPSEAPRVQIDHVLITDEFRVAEFSVPQVEVSDHLPIFTTLEFREP